MRTGSRSPRSPCGGTNSNQPKAACGLPARWVMGDDTFRGRKRADLSSRSPITGSEEVYILMRRGTGEWMCNTRVVCRVTSGVAQNTCTFFQRHPICLSDLRRCCDVIEHYAMDFAAIPHRSR